MSMTEPPVPHEPPVLNRQPHIRVAKSSYGGGLLRKLNASIPSNWYQSQTRHPRAAATASGPAEPPQRRRRMRLLIAGFDLDIQDQAQAGHPVGVQRVRRPPRLVRIIARSFLVAEQRLDRGIHVQNPRNPQQRRLVEMTVQPNLRVGFRQEAVPTLASSPKPLTPAGFTSLSFFGTRM